MDINAPCQLLGLNCVSPASQTLVEVLTPGACEWTCLEGGSGQMY